MSRLDTKFRELRKNRRKAFIAFITAGYPSLSATEKLIREFACAGADVIELGVPFSDPMADGPVIQESSFEALKKKTHLQGILGMVKKVRSHVDTPICLMTYYNPIFILGEERFVRQAVACGVDGVIVPDLPPEEGKTFAALARKYKLDNICFIAPTTSLKRVKYICSVARGFIYYVSLTGVTGARQALPDDLIKNLKTIKRLTHKPVCVGFGVSTCAQVRQINKFADGVIVGSAIVKKIKENIGRSDMVKRVGRFVKGLSSP
jgi:tryptophan synthase alpha chain